MPEILDIIVRARGARTVARDLAKISSAAAAGSVSLNTLSASTARAGAASGAAAGKFTLGAAGATRLGAASAIAATSLTSLAAAAGIAGGAIAVAFGLPLVAAVKIAGDFEASMNRVQNVSRATPEEMVKISDAAKELGITTAFSASQAADGFELLSKAGFDVETQLQSITPALNLAAAGQLELGQSAGIVTGIIAGFGLKVEDIGDAADILTRTSQTSKATIEGLGQAFSFVAPKARELGISFIDVNVALGALNNAGVPAQRAGRGLQRMLSNLTNSTPQAKKALEALKVSVFDNKGAFIGLLPLVQKLRVATKDLTAEARAAVLGDIFTEQGGRAAGALISQGDAIAGLKTKISDFQGAAQSAADTILKGLNGSLREMSSAVQGAGIAVGEHLLAPVEFVVDGITILFRVIASLPQPIQTLIGFVLSAGTAFGVLTLALAAAAFASAAFARLQASQAILAMRGMAASALTAAGGITTLKVSMLVPTWAGFTAAMTGVGAALTRVAAAAKLALVSLGVVGAIALGVVAAFAALVIARNDVVAFGEAHTTLSDIATVVWGDIISVFSDAEDAQKKLSATTETEIDKMNRSFMDLSLGEQILKVYDKIELATRIIFRVLSEYFSRLTDPILSPFRTLAAVIVNLPKLLSDPGNAGELFGKILAENVFVGFRSTDINALIEEEMAQAPASKVLGSTSTVKRAAALTAGRKGGDGDGPQTDGTKTLPGTETIDLLTGAQERQKTALDALRQSANGLTPTMISLAKAQMTLRDAVAEGSISAAEADRIYKSIGENTFNQLLGQIDPVSAALSQQRVMLDSLAVAAAAGSISLERLAEAQGLVRAKTDENLLGMSEVTEKFTSTEALSKGVQEGFKGFGESLGTEFEIISQGTHNLLGSGMDALNDFLTTGKFAFKSFALGAVKEIQKIITQILIMKAIKAIGQSFGGGVPGVDGAAAGGGAMKAGETFLVGEKGPELFTAPRSGQVVPNDQLGSMGAAPSVNVSVVNVDDTSGIPEVMKTKEGEDAIMNVIQRNPGKLRQMIS